jgi:hypothetical protein
MEVPLTWGWWPWLLVAGGGGWWQNPEALVRGGPRDLFVFSLFVKGLCAIRVDKLFSVFYYTVSIFVHIFVLYP